MRNAGRQETQKHSFPDFLSSAFLFFLRSLQSAKSNRTTKYGNGKQIRNSKVRLAGLFRVFLFRVSNLFRISCFGFRVLGNPDSVLLPPPGASPAYTPILQTCRHRQCISVSFMDLRRKSSLQNARFILQTCLLCKRDPVPPGSGFRRAPTSLGCGRAQIPLPSGDFMEASSYFHHDAVPANLCDTAIPSWRPKTWS
jgi:hypothetical protein